MTKKLKFFPDLTFSFYLGLWCILPSFFRFLTVVKECSSEKHFWVVIWYPMLWGVFLDLIVALQIFVLVYFVYHICESKRVQIILHSFLGAVLGAFYLVDYYYLKLSGSHIEYKLLHYISDSAALLSSAQEITGGHLLLYILISIVVLPCCFTFYFKSFTFRMPNIKQISLICAIVVAGAVLPCFLRDFFDARFIIKKSANPILLDEALSIYEFWNLRSLSKKTIIASENPLIPKAEDAQYLSSEYPFLKDTRGFHGPRNFDINIDPQKKPNLIFLFMESFRAKDIGCLGGEYNVSPNFDQLAREGLLFTQFYCNGIQTSRSVIASLFGTLPYFSFSKDSFQAKFFHLPLVGIADLLKKTGYSTSYLCSGQLGFENQEAFFSNHSYDYIFGEDDIRAKYPNALGTSFGISDEYLLRYSVDFLKQKNKEGKKIFSVIYTITNHHPWIIPDERFNIFKDKGEYGKFLNTFAYSDWCLGLFIKLLKKENLYDNSIIFILADTGQPMGEHDNNFLLTNSLYEESIHIPLLILAPGRQKEPKQLPFIASQVDLLPTVMDIFNLTGHNHAVGDSLMRDVPERMAFFNSTFGGGYWGARKGNYKYIFSVCGKQHLLFDLSKDPLERENIALEEKDIVEDFFDPIVTTYQLYKQSFQKGLMPLK